VDVERRLRERLKDWRALLAGNVAWTRQLLGKLLTGKIFAWDVINEPEWVTCSLGARRRSCVSLATMKEFVRDSAALVHRHTGQAVTVGSASAQWFEAWRDVGLDFYQAHWYEHLERRAPLARPVRDLKLDRPVMLGEFPSRLPSRELQRILERARAAGYSAAFVWSVLANDAATVSVSYHFSRCRRRE
jgi:hypothetical protein